jgi:hypothetical protein
LQAVARRQQIDALSLRPVRDRFHRHLRRHGRRAVGMEMKIGGEQHSLHLLPARGFFKPTQEKIASEVPGQRDP